MDLAVLAYWSPSSDTAPPEWGYLPVHHDGLIDVGHADGRVAD
jgi:hypothetical protein